MRPIRLLIADDSAAFRALLRRHVATEAILDLVGEARDGSEAIDLVCQLRPDVAVLDRGMPKVGGLKVPAAARARRDDLQTRFVLLTATHNAQIRRDAHAAGFDACLTKGASRGEILAALLRAAARADPALFPAASEDSTQE